MPDGWEVVRLGEVAEVLTGSTPPREVNDYYGGCTPWVKLSDLATSHLVRTSDEYLTDKGLAISRMVPKGSVLVSCIGTIGEVAIAGVPLCFNQQINALIPSALVTSSFLYWACLTRANYMAAIASKTAVPILNKREFSKTPILLPPLTEQRAIAAVLDSIDEAIERTEAVIAATERLRDALLHELLTRGVPGWHSEWKEVLGIGTIPACWEVVRLGDVAEINHSNWNPATGSAILYLDLTSVTEPGVLAPPKDISATDAPSRARRRVRSGDILVSTVRPNLRGFARVPKAPKDLVASTGFAVVSPGNDVNGSFIYHHVMTSQFAEYLENATTGQAYPAVLASDVAGFRLPLPPLPEQRAMAALLEGVDDAIDALREEQDRSQAMKASTADALLAGRVRVERT